jgi:hypothetical protein
MQVGGLNEAKESTAEVQALVDQLASEIKSQAGGDYPHLKAVSYRSQVVAGTNYYIKVNFIKCFYHTSFSNLNDHYVRLGRCW